jgi:hypothetical protein
LNYDVKLGLPLFCRKEDVLDYNIATGLIGPGMARELDVATKVAIAELSKKIGEKAMDDLLDLFEFYKVPIGFLPRMFRLTKNYKVIEFIIDDSKVQGDPYVVDGPSRLTNTLDMVMQWTQFLTFIPSSQNISISYTTGGGQIFSRGKQTRQYFVKQIHDALEEKKQEGASDSLLPNYDGIINSFASHGDAKVARFILAIPFVSDDESKLLAKAIANRSKKDGNPVTFLTHPEKFHDQFELTVLSYVPVL